jgi:hypothetical protein
MVSRTGFKIIQFPADGPDLASDPDLAPDPDLASDPDLAPDPILAFRKGKNSRFWTLFVKINQILP